jgi:hypothetical protein
MRSWARRASLHVISQSSTPEYWYSWNNCIIRKISMGFSRIRRGIDVNQAKENSKESKNTSSAGISTNCFQKKIIYLIQVLTR